MSAVFLYTQSLVSGYTYPNVLVSFTLADVQKSSIFSEALNGAKGVFAFCSARSPITRVPSDLSLGATNVGFEMASLCNACQMAKRRSILLSLISKAQ